MSTWFRNLLPALTLAATAAGTAVDTPLAEQPCPSGLPGQTRCLAGRDSAGAYLLIALPADWNGGLVLHAHGGPFLGAPTARRVAEDLQRWAVVPRAGYAWAGSSFRQGGVAVLDAAADVERLRGIFVDQVAKPRWTVLHGQSWGASVAARAAESIPKDKDGRPLVQAVLLSSGVLGGGSRSYDMRLDLRLLYQQLCANHPRPDEPAYPLWMGLPANSRLSGAELDARINACLALDKPAAQRTPEQARRVDTLTAVLRIPETSIAAHLRWATFHFQDIVQNRSGGRNPFGNIGARYRGSPDDDALNRAVARYAVDPQGLRRFAQDADPSGAIDLPVLSVHGISDATAFVELEHQFAQTMAAAGRAERLVQGFVDESSHSYLGDAIYVGALQALQAWSEQGLKPTPQSLAAACERARQRFPSRCSFVTDFVPAPLDSRVTPRERP